MKSPLLSPADSVEVLELLETLMVTLRNTAHYGALRKELRLQLENMARECEALALKIRKSDSFDDALLNAIDAYAAEQGVPFQKVLKDAMEIYISNVNRKFFGKKNNNND